MFSSIRSKVAAFLGLVAMLSCSLVWAQVQNPPQRAPQPGQPQVQRPPQQQFQQQVPQHPQQQQRFSAVPQAHQQAGNTDAQLASWLIVDNQNEVALAKMAQERAKNNDIKQFCEKMRDDHQRMVTKLQQLSGMQAQQQPGAAGANVQNQGRPVEPRVNAEARAPQATTTVAAQPPMHHGLNFVALKRELGAQCLQSAERELSSKSGSEFDECFLGMQMGIHHEAIVTMTVFRNHASPQLQQDLDKGIETAQAHLKRVKELMKEEKGSKSGT